MADNQGKGGGKKKGKGGGGGGKGGGGSQQNPQQQQGGGDGKKKGHSPHNVPGDFPALGGPAAKTPFQSAPQDFPSLGGGPSQQQQQPSGGKQQQPSQGKQQQQPSGGKQKHQQPNQGKQEQQPSGGKQKQQQPSQGKQEQQPSGGKQKQQHPSQGKQEQQPSQGKQQQQPSQGKQQQQPSQGKQQQQGGKGEPAPQATPSQVTESMGQMQIGPKSNGKSVMYPIPRRTNRTGGTKGIKSQVDTNHFAITFKNPNIVIFHYDVAIDPDKPVRYMRKVVQKVAKEYFPGGLWGYDGKKNIFSKGKLPFGEAMSAKVSIFDEERFEDKEYEVEIKKAQEISFKSIVDYMMTGVNKPQIAIQALDVILREPATSNELFVRVGRSYFSRPIPQNLIQLGNGLELWNGFYQTAGIGWKPFLNIDVAHKGFPSEQSILSIIKEICRGELPQQIRPFEMLSLKDWVSGLKVLYQIPNLTSSKKIFKINKIVGSALEEKFTLTGQTRTISVAEYFQNNKNYKLRYPQYPCFQVGSTAKNNRIPCELCTLVGGQISNKKMNENQTAAMVKAAATPTDQRRSKIMDAIRKVNLGGNRLLEDFGIGVSGQMERVNSRILNAPTVTYRERDIRVAGGQWRADKFLDAKKVTTWAIVLMVRAGRFPVQWRSIIDNIPRGANFVGMAFEGKPVDVFEDAQNNERNMKDVFMQLKRKNVQLTFVIIPNAGDTYSKVKQIAEQEVGILTQCIRERTVSKLNPATTGNILLKINAKMSGTNHSVKDLKAPQILSRPTIIFGADVTHPSPDETNIPSIAAVTSSFDHNAFKYQMMWNLQDPRCEVILLLEQMVREHILFFRSKTNVKPERIIFYRDGVSEGQFQEILGSEVQAIQRACQSIENGYKPSITFLVVQKRHHTRFFPPNPAEGDGSRNNNVKVGTVVDTTITHPTDLDFYLVSHQSIQGTARPTKYYKLYDSLQLTDDQIEEMTYYLCHLFTRCTRSVSYPAPTYYAHLAAFRARAYIKNRKINMLNLPRENQVLKINETFISENPMFFV